MKESETRSLFRITVVVDAPKQSEKDMEFNAQEYIQMDCENDDLYIEAITLMKHYNEKHGYPRQEEK